MIGRQTRLLLAVNAGVLVALFAEPVCATLILPANSGELPSWATVESTFRAGPSPPRSQDEEDNDRQAVQIAQCLPGPPATTGNCNSVSQSSGGEWNAGALANAIWSLPPDGPPSGVPSESRVIRPIPPPFELLRPV
jgi:hypothetical protein